MTIRSVSLVLCLAFIALFANPTSAQQGLAKRDSDSNVTETKVEHDQRMRWWREARFGMFIHWGLYAVPAGEYNGKRSDRIGEWIMEWANIPRADYEKFAT